MKHPVPIPILTLGEISRLVTVLPACNVISNCDCSSRLILESLSMMSDINPTTATWLQYVIDSQGCSNPQIWYDRWNWSPNVRHYIQAYPNYLHHYIMAGGIPPEKNEGDGRITSQVSRTSQVSMTMTPDKWRSNPEITVLLGREDNCGSIPINPDVVTAIKIKHLITRDLSVTDVSTMRSISRRLSAIKPILSEVGRCGSVLEMSMSTYYGRLVRHACISHFDSDVVCDVLQHSERWMWWTSKVKKYGCRARIYMVPSVTLRYLLKCSNERPLNSSEVHLRLDRLMDNPEMLKNVTLEYYAGSQNRNGSDIPPLDIRIPRGPMSGLHLLEYLTTVEYHISIQPDPSRL